MGYNLHHIPVFSIAAITTEHKLIVLFHSIESQESDRGLRLKPWCLGYNEDASRAAFLPGG